MTNNNEKHFEMDLQLFGTEDGTGDGKDKKDTTTVVDDKTDKTDKIVNPDDKKDTGDQDKDKPANNNDVQALLDKLSNMEKMLENATKKEEPKDDKTIDKDINKGTDEEDNAKLKVIQDELTKLKESITAQTSKVTDYEAYLNEMVNAKVESIPEELKGLIPEGLSVKDKLSWITKAEQAGLFGSKGSIEIGKPYNPKNNTQTDTAKLSPSSLMAMAYGKSAGKKK